jgi:O-antigen/teichoic acid export membrane protein
VDKKKLNNRVANAAKWSVITEIAAKLVTPISTMILARLLVPEAFGVVATVTMIVSFAEMFADAGFQKYLIQHEFTDDNHRVASTNVAFWTNLIVAIFIWIIIIIFRERLAILVGNPGLGIVIAIACVQLPITAFSSIQMALYRRDFDFKTLFLIRIIAICIPFVVTMPLAFLGWGYWSLIIGTISGALLNAIILTLKSKWKPQLFFSFSLLKEMFSFSVWTLMEALSIWLIAWVDAFIIGSALNSYYLGLYKTSQTTVNGIMGIVTAATTPVLFAALSRLQNDESTFNMMYFKIQKLVAYAIFPMGTGIYLYSDVVTQILLGSQWNEASAIIGIWGVTSAIVVVVSNFSSEVYRAKGRPRLSFISHLLHLVVLVPACIISLNYGFGVLVLVRALVRLEGVVVGLIIMKYAIKFPIKNILSNISKPLLFTLLMCVAALGLQQISSTFIWGLISIVLCATAYFGMMWLFAKSDVKLIMNTFLKKNVG